MTKETRLIFDLSDISAIKLVCANEDCGSELTLPPNLWYKLPKQCPHCDDSWDHGTLRECAVLTTAISRILKHVGAPVELRFEMHLPCEED